MSPRRLNLGCGRDIKQDWVNLDSKDLPGVDIVCDIEKLPLPFDEGEFDEIRCANIIEHVDYIPVLKDLYRILKPGARLRVRVPHFTSRNNYVDPTHMRLFSIDTFEFFVANSEVQKDYYFDFHFSRITYRKIKFQKKGLFWPNRLIEHLVNSARRIQYLYESTFLCRLFPANDIVVEFVK